MIHETRPSFGGWITASGARTSRVVAEPPRLYVSRRVVDNEAGDVVADAVEPQPVTSRAVSIP